MRVRRINECPACGSRSCAEVARAAGEAKQRFLELSERKYGGLMNGWLADVDLVVARCGACGHHWYREQPDEEQLARLYESARPLLEGRTADKAGYCPHMLAEMRRFRGLVGRGSHTSVPTLLDYGAGSGRWARAAAEAGFIVTAYEPSTTRAAPAGGRVAAVAHASALEGRLFDAINLEQVLEHTADPAAELRRVSGLCHPGTVLRITVPNIDRPVEGRAVWRDWPFDGRRMHTMAPFEHLHGFTPRSIEALVRRAGFAPMSPSSFWRDDALHAARRVIGRVAPRVAQTKLLAVPSVAAVAAAE
jgi:SAM-dependent methyltransferase